MALGGIGGMGGQNMDLTNLLGAPLVADPAQAGRGMFGMSDSSRAMLARALMGMSMRQPMTHPLQALGQVASMWAAGKTASDADEAKQAATLAKEEKERQAKLARQAQARTALGTLGQSLYSGQGMEGFEGLIGEEDPYADLRAALSLRRGIENDRRPRSGSGERDSYPVGGITVQYGPDGQPYYARFNSRTGTFEAVPGAGRPINERTGLPYDPTDPLPGNGPAAPAARRRFSLFDPSTWGGGGGETPAEPAPTQPSGRPMPAPRPGVPVAPGAAAPVPRGPTIEPPRPPDIPLAVWAEMTPDEKAAVQ